MLAEKTVINDCYVLVSQIGEDSTTERWIATAIYSAKRFLLRFIKGTENRPDIVARLREASLRSYSICGPTIADYVELELWNGRAFIASEYVEEQTLLRAIERGQRMTPLGLAHTGISLAEALSSFHAMGAFYGNLNAENVLYMDRRERVPIVKVVKPELYSLMATLPGNERYLVESRAYIAPECKKGKDPDAASDIYGVGMNLFRCATGKLPFPDGEETIRNGAASTKFVVASLLFGGVGEDIARVITRCLMSDPLLRYGTAAELIADLTDLVSREKHETAKDDALSELSRSGRAIAMSSYFKDIGEGGTDMPQNARSLPADDSAFVLVTPELCRRVPAENSWSVDDYMEWGVRTVFGREPVPRAGLSAKGPPAPAATKKEDDVPAMSGGTASLLTSPDEIRIRAANARYPEIRRETIEHLLPDGKKPHADRSTAPPPVAGTPTREREARKKAKAPTVPKRSWMRQSVRVTEIREILRRSVDLAKTGRGSMRFIEEPTDVYGPSGVFDLLETLGDSSLYVNAGSFARFGSADIADFSLMLSKAFRKHGSPAATGVSEFGKTADGLVRALSLRASRRIPLLLVVRGGECVSKELGEAFSIIASGIARKPVAIAVFFSKRLVPDWHPLAALAP